MRAAVSWAPLRPKGPLGRRGNRAPNMGQVLRGVMDGWAMEVGWRVRVI